MSLSPSQEALIADRLRVWHVRRACQVATLSASTGRPSEDTPRGDAALDALLRCLLYELSGDIAAVTLLDQSTQYFLAVIPRSALHTADVTGSTRQWYGCQSISHGGGLCVRTITMQSDPSAETVFEIFDLTDGHTKELPVVDGTAASFRHYLGVPLTIRDGQRVGTLFVFKDKPAHEGLSRTHRHFMHETARQVIDQIYLNIEALESKRALRCNSAVLDLLNACESGGGNQLELVETTIVEDPCSQIYQHAAKLLTQAFEFDGVIIQEIPWSLSDVSSTQSRRASLLGCHHRPEGLALVQLPDVSIQYLMKAFPSGAVCHLLSESERHGTFAASLPGSPEFSTNISLERFANQPIPEQFIFMPLLNTYHHRHTAFILGCATGTDRVYSSATDLLPLSAFGMAIMSQIRRIEEQSLDRKKNDFLGSVSHEMRSPLHGVMACIDLAREAESHTQQLDLLDSASSCALQLGDNIDNLLTYANIGSPSRSRKQPRKLRVRIKEPHADQSVCSEDTSADVAVNLTTFIEDVLAKERSKRKSITPAKEHQRRESLDAQDSTWHAVVVVDSTPSADLSIVPQSDIGVIVSNLLSNCLKFTAPSGCIRVSLEADEAEVRLLFRDTANGIPLDFVSHKLFVPFAQQDPLDPGMGLGLSLVHNAVHRLDGKISFQTDEAEGTDFFVNLPRAHFMNSDQGTQIVGLQSSIGDAVDLSSLTAQLLVPGRWKRDGEETLRNQRCLETFITSLTQTLSTWCHVDLQLCTEPWDISGPIPDVVLLLHSDIEEMRRIAGDAFDDTKKVLLCPEEAAETHVRESALKMYTTISGPVMPYKVISALKMLLQIHQSQARTSEEPAAESAGIPELMVEPQRIDEDVPFNPRLVPIQDEKIPLHHVVSFESEISPLQPTTIDIYREPKLLLVDDNAINLKVLEMFAKKCSKLPAIAAGGGREAIAEFELARNSQAFDIILLDLSMPEVSGFDVAAAVRQLELEDTQLDLPRTYIVALTGLVSEKDRDAAFAAGVDEYVTKPASLRDLLNVVEDWRSIRGFA